MKAKFITLASHVFLDPSNLVRSLSLCPCLIFLLTSSSHSLHFRLEVIRFSVFFSETHRPNKRLCVDKTSQLMYRLIFVLAFIIAGISEKRTASQEQISFLPEMCCFPGMMRIRLLQTKAGGCHKL